MNKKTNIAISIFLIAAIVVGAIAAVLSIVYMVGGKNFGAHVGEVPDVPISEGEYANFNDDLAATATLKVPNGSTQSGSDAAVIRGRKGAYIDIQLDEVQNVNTVVLSEIGVAEATINLFRIYYKDSSGEFKFIYQQDIIENYRYCTFDMVRTDTIRIKIVGTKKDANWAIKKLSVYKMGKTHEDNYRVSAYMTMNSIQNPQSVDSKHMEVINYVNLFNGGFNAEGDITWEYGINEYGEFIDGKKMFEVALKNVRAKMTSGTKIVVTFLARDYANPTLTVGQVHTGAMKTNKEKFTKNLLQFIKHYGLDGVAFDWEHPVDNKEWAIFFNFCRYFQEQKKPGQLLTAAIGSWLVKPGQLDYDDLEVLDIIDLMTYDILDKNGYHSPFVNACYEPIGQVEFMDKIKGTNIIKKINIGLPFYSRPLDNAEYWGTYSNVAEELGKFTNLYTPDVYLNGELLKFNYYNSYQMIYDKTAYTMDKNVGGVMIWHYACDLPGSHPLSLINAIGAAIVNRK